MIISPGITLSAGIKISPDSSGFITNGLILNLDAGNASSYPGSGTTWTDLSGVGNNFAFNDGDPSFTSAGNQSYFYFGNVATGGNILPATAYTKIAIFQVFGGFGNIISGGITNYDHTFWGAGSQYLYSGHNGNWTGVGSANPVPINQWVFGAVSFDTTNGWRLYLGTETPVTYSDTGTFSPDPAGVEIGGFQGNGNNMNGDVAVALIYNRVLSDAEITQLHTYYQSRFTNLY
jgi:hypothetical protein